MACAILERTTPETTAPRYVRHSYIQILIKELDELLDFELRASQQVWDSNNREEKNAGFGRGRWHSKIGKKF